MKPLYRLFSRLPCLGWWRTIPTSRKIFLGASLFLSIVVGAVAGQYWRAGDYVIPAGSPIGGDYAAFFAASEAIAQSMTADIYRPEVFHNLVTEVGPPFGTYALLWQYPPTFYFYVAPLAHIGFLPGFALWTGLGILAFLLALRTTGAPKLALYVTLASPAALFAVITGQNGFFTGALIALAALYPDRRPVLAGLAAALLTMKPHLGLLLPFAYLAGGMGRAFATAAIGTLALVAASVFAFGTEAWTAFFTEAGVKWEILDRGLWPVWKMVTPASAASFAGLPPVAALTFHGVVAILTVVTVSLIWRRVPDADLRAAALCAGIFLVTPYAYFYELIVLALPALVVAQRALRNGWLPYEPLMLGLIYALPIVLPDAPRQLGINWGFVTVILVAILVLRRIDHHHPSALPGPWRPSGIAAP